LSSGTGSPPLLIGLTGPIGCGKSTIGRMLADLGALVIDADAVAREVTGPGQPALAAIRTRFGGGVFDEAGRLDRAALARVVFADPEAMRDLERLTHPRVREVVDDRLVGARDEAVPVVAIEAIKLIEGGLADRCDEVWLVDCDPSTQRHRLTGRGMTAEDMDRRIAAQGEQLAQRLVTALGGRVRHRLIRTDGSLEATRVAVEDALADALLAHPFVPGQPTPAEEP
jgi:dephospho-CoA kinase